jgi:hypothetical protein
MAQSTEPQTFRLSCSAAGDASVLREEWRCKLRKIILAAHDAGITYATTHVPGFEYFKGARGVPAQSTAAAAIVEDLLLSHGYEIRSSVCDVGKIRCDEEIDKIKIVWRERSPPCVRRAADNSSELPLADDLRESISEDAVRKYGPGLQAKLDAAPKDGSNIEIYDEGLSVGDGFFESGMLRVYMFLLREQGYNPVHVDASYVTWLPDHIVVSRSP